MIADAVFPGEGKQLDSERVHGWEMGCQIRHVLLRKLFACGGDFSDDQLVPLVSCTLCLSFSTVLSVLSKDGMHQFYGRKL